MPFRTVLDLGLISIKSDLLFKMQLEAPVSMHIGFPPTAKHSGRLNEDCLRESDHQKVVIYEHDCDGCQWF